MSQDNNSVNYKSEDTKKEHKEEENDRFGRGRRGNQEENGRNQDSNTDRKNDNPRGSNKEFDKPDSGSEKNHQNNHENSLENQNKNQDQGDDNRDKKGDSEDISDGRGRDDEPERGRDRDDRSEGGHWRDNHSDGRSERGEFDEYEEECERVEPKENEKDCDEQKPELNNPRHDFSDDGDHGWGPKHHLPPPGGPSSQVSSDRPGFLERVSAYNITFSSETMIEVLLGSLLILASVVFLFIYLVKRQRRKSTRNQSPVRTLQLVASNQNIATSNFYQYYQKEGLIPTGTVVGYIPEGQFLRQPGAKNVEDLKSFGRLPTQDEILDLS